MNKLLIHDIEEMAVYASEIRMRGDDIGLVPTMGALHQGHLSLIKKAAAENEITIVSVFVNPIQFDSETDLALYPKTLETDAEAAFSSGADVVFAPSKDRMYPEGFSTFVDMTGLTEKLCGASREAHFRGVLTVVNKLFGICQPTRAYFGEKDAQQLAAVRKMAVELNMRIRIIGCPTVREEDGLAMSSRNTRLSAEDRKTARALYRALSLVKDSFISGNRDAGSLYKVLADEIGAAPSARLDYAEIVDPLTFEPVMTASEGDLVMLAVYIGDVRLIDNIKL